MTSKLTVLTAVIALFGLVSIVQISAVVYCESSCECQPNQCCKSLATGELVGSWNYQTGFPATCQSNTGNGVPYGGQCDPRCPLACYCSVQLECHRFGRFCYERDPWR